LALSDYRNSVADQVILMLMSRDIPPSQRRPSMKRTLTLISAAVFAGALALPAFAQIGTDISGDAAVSEHSEQRDSTHEYRSETIPPPAPVMHDSMRKESETREYRSDDMGSPEMSHRVERKETRRTTTEAAPPPVMEHRETRTSRTERRNEDNDRHGIGAGVGANVGGLGAHVGAGADVGGRDSGGY
jgi:hypothetical protein